MLFRCFGLSQKIQEIEKNVFYKRFDFPNFNSRETFKTRMGTHTRVSCMVVNFSIDFGCRQTFFFMQNSLTKSTFKFIKNISYNVYRINHRCNKEVYALLYLRKIMKVHLNKCLTISGHAYINTL